MPRSRHLDPFFELPGRFAMRIVLSTAARLLGLGFGILLLLTAASPSLAQTGLQLNGSNQYVTFGVASDLGASRFTLELWFRRDGAGATTSTGTGGVTAVPLITKGRGEADGSNKDMNFFLGVSAANVLVDESGAQPSRDRRHSHRERRLVSRRGDL
jgi:hypothetical protein